MCTKCRPLYLSNISNGEQEIYEYIKEIYNGDILQSDRTLLEKREIDIYLPDIKLGIEFNGLYRHCDLSKDDKYHYDKTNECFKNGVKLIHIWEDQWKDDIHIIKSKLLNIINKTDDFINIDIYIIKEISDYNTYQTFLDENNLDDYVKPSLILGLYYQNELVSIALFDEYIKDSYELICFCDSYSKKIDNSLELLFDYFCKNYSFNTINTYLNRGWDNPNRYIKIGFKYIKLTEPKFWYIDINSNDKIRKTIKDKTLISNFNKIYDAGKIKFIYT